jgi:hypothetical protein
MESDASPRNSMRQQHYFTRGREKVRVVTGDLGLELLVRRPTIYFAGRGANEIVVGVAMTPRLDHTVKTQFAREGE